MNRIVEYNEQSLTAVALWTSYSNILKDLLLPSIAGIYSVCVILGNLTSNFTLMKSFSNVPYEVIELDGVGQLDSTTSLMLDGIESGCNTFIIHHHVILDFLDVFVDIHDQANYRNPNKYVLFLMEEPASDDFLESIRAHSSEIGLVNGDQVYSVNGPNGFLLVEFCKKRNCSIELVVDSVHMWGEIYPNRTGNGILGNVVERRADFGIGAISSWYHCFEYLSFSFAFQKGGVTCLVPKPKQLPRWKEIAMAFSTYVYLITIVSFCFVVAIYMLIVRFSVRSRFEKSIVWNALNVLAIYLLQSTSVVRNRSVSESLLSVTVLIFSLNLATIYSGKYASLRTIPMYEPAIDSKDDLAKSGIPWVQIHEAWAYDFSMSENPLCDAAFASARMHNGHLMLGEWIDAGNIHKYQLMKNDLYYVLKVAMSTKTWPLLERFNDLLSRTAEGLLLMVHERKNIYRYNDYYVQVVALNSHIRGENKPTALAIEDVLGCCDNREGGGVCNTVHN
ncbi:hypothetical protein RP20_CCG026946 [Aedes albopictus]|nr:hypothetical protein RP20_CCG026946 [Aedes albopictus]